MSDRRTRRGRPKGSGIDDRRRLDAIARLIMADPRLRPTTAIRSLGISDPSVIRRLRDKFNAVRSDLMQDLKAHAANPRTKSAVRAANDDTPRRKIAVSSETKAAQRHTSPAPARSAATATKRPASRAIAASTRTMPTRVARASQPKSKPSAPEPAIAASARSAPRSASTPPRPRGHAGDDDGEGTPARANPTANATELFTTLFSAGVAATNTLMAAHTTLANEFLQSRYILLALRQQLAFCEWAVGLVPAFQVPTKTAT
jgi:hypothetical protein